MQYIAFLDTGLPFFFLNADLSGAEPCRAWSHRLYHVHRLVGQQCEALIFMRPKVALAEKHLLPHGHGIGPLRVCDGVGRFISKHTDSLGTRPHEVSQPLLYVRRKRLTRGLATSSGEQILYSRIGE